VKICCIQKCTFLTYLFLVFCVIDLIGFCATYAKIYPTLKPYEYGFRVFLITYCFITVSGYRTGEFLNTAINRFLLIALGASVSLGVNICIYPIWAGEDLHNLVTKNFIGVATSLEGILQYFIYHLTYSQLLSNLFLPWLYCNKLITVVFLFSLFQALSTTTFSVLNIKRCHLKFLFTKLLMTQFTVATDRPLNLKVKKMHWYCLFASVFSGS